ncbi:MAG TPA: hypothetical protein VF645_00250 [Allosphingosinicella sp.]|jgi:hypothetical protein
METKSKDDVINDLYRRAFGEVTEDVREGRISREAALDIMRSAALEFYPECVHAFGHGSALKGKFSPYSDMDVIVYVPTGQFWEKRCVNYKGHIVEIQAYSLDSLQLFAMFAANSGIALGLVPLDAEIVFDRDGGAAALKAELAVKINAGPDAPPNLVLESYRLKLTNLIVELATAQKPAEKVACGLQMYEQISRVLLTKATGWLHSGKWVPRMLEASGSNVFDTLVSAYRALMADDTTPLVFFACETLESIGGPFWDGYVQQTPFRMELLPVPTIIIAGQQFRA